MEVEWYTLVEKPLSFGQVYENLVIKHNVFMWKSDLASNKYNTLNFTKLTTHHPEANVNRQFR